MRQRGCRGKKQEPRRGPSLGKVGEVGTGVGDSQAVLGAGQGSREGRRYLCILKGLHLQGCVPGPLADLQHKEPRLHLHFKILSPKTRCQERWCGQDQRLAESERHRWCVLSGEKEEWTQELFGGTVTQTCQQLCSQ